MGDSIYGSGDNRAGKSSPACAACKYHRRKCVPNCPLAPFFPADAFKAFLNTRRLFGMKNILKTLRNLNPDNRINAVKALIYEANAREADPVGGSFGVLCRLRRQIEVCQAELDDVMQKIDIFRAMDISSSLYPIEDGLNSQDSLAQQFSNPYHDYQEFDERPTERELEIYSNTYLTVNEEQPLEYQGEASKPLMGLVQQPPASISSGLEQHRGGGDTEPEKKQ